MALGFWDTPGAFSVVGEFARGGFKVLDLEDQDKVAAVVVILPEKPGPWPMRGRFCSDFLGWWDTVFAGVLAKTGCRTWYFAGESWEVDGQFWARKTCHFYRIYFCRIPAVGI